MGRMLGVISCVWRLKREGGALVLAPAVSALLAVAATTVSAIAALAASVALPASIALTTAIALPASISTLTTITAIASLAAIAALAAVTAIAALASVTATVPATASVASASTPASSAALSLGLGNADLDLLTAHSAAVHLRDAGVGLVLVVEGHEGVPLPAVEHVGHRAKPLKLSLNIRLVHVLVNSVHEKLRHFEYSLVEVKQALN